MQATLRGIAGLPPATASNIGGFIARNIGPLLPVSRVAHTNLRLAMPELDSAARRRIVRGVWDNLGRTVAELPHLPALRATASGPGWEIENAHILHEQAARGGPAIFMSGHIGNWEIMPPAVASCGMSMSSVYRAASNPAVTQAINALRAQALGRPDAMFPKGAAGARRALRHLSQGGFLGMLVDQKLNDGIAVPFFGHDAMTAPALAQLALRFRCAIIPGHVRRIGPARLRLVVDPPLPLPDSGDKAQDVAQLTLQVNQTLERWIRQRPEAWLWLHRRWPKALYRAG